MNKVAIGTIVGTALLGLAKSRFGNKNETLIDMSEMISQGRVLGNGNFSIAVELDSDPDNVYLVSTDYAKEFMADMHKKQPDNPHIPNIVKVGYITYKPKFIGNYKRSSKSDINFSIGRDYRSDKPIYVYKTRRLDFQKVIPCNATFRIGDIDGGNPNFSEVACRDLTPAEESMLHMLRNEIENFKTTDGRKIELWGDKSFGNILYDTEKDIIIFYDPYYVVDNMYQIDLFKESRGAVDDYKGMFQ